MKTRTPARYGQAAWVGLALLAGAGIRFWIANRSGMWRDECQGLFVAGLPNAQAILDFLHYHESHPPLFYLLMRYWMMAFGRSDTGLAGLQVVLSVITSFTVYQVANRVFGRIAALVACVLTVFSALVVENSTLVRPYALLQLECLISVWLLWKLLAEDVTVLALFGYVAVTAALLYTHNWACLILAGEWIAVGASLYYRSAQLRESHLSVYRCCLTLLGGQLLILAAYAPWCPILLHQFAVAGHPPDPLTLISGPMIVAKTWGFPAAGLLIALLIALAGRQSAIRKAVGWSELAEHTSAPSVVRERRKIAIGYLVFQMVPAVAISLALLLSAHSSLVQPRCFSIVWPCLLIVTGQIIALGIFMDGRSRVTSLISALLFAAMVLQSIYRLDKIHQRAKSNARELACFLARFVGPSDLVIIAPEWIASSYNWYYKGSGREAVFPSGKYEALMPFDRVIDRTTDPAGFSNMEARLDGARDHGLRVWFVIDALNVPSPEACQAAALPQLDAEDYIRAGNLQSQRLYCLLTSLFGEPTEQMKSAGLRQGAEMRTPTETACLRDLASVRRIRRLVVERQAAFEAISR
jgi:hypothetical protein